MLPATPPALVFRRFSAFLTAAAAAICPFMSTTIGR